MNNDELVEFFKKFFISYLLKEIRTYSFTSQDFSWLQNGQLNIVSNGSIIFLFGGGFLAFFLLPIFESVK